MKHNIDPHIWRVLRFQGVFIPGMIFSLYMAFHHYDWLAITMAAWIVLWSICFA